MYTVYGIESNLTVLLQGVPLCTDMLGKVGDRKCIDPEDNGNVYMSSFNW